MEALDESRWSRGSNPGATMLDAVEIEIDLIGVPFGTAEPAPIVGEDPFVWQVGPAIEGQYVVADGPRLFSLPRKMAWPEGQEDRSRDREQAMSADGEVPRRQYGLPALSRADGSVGTEEFKFFLA